MRRGLAAALAALLLAACASTPKAPLGPAPPSRPTPPKPDRNLVLRLDELPGWETEDHVAALTAFRATCRVAKGLEMAMACRRARDVPAQDKASARRFFETSFRAEPLPGSGRLTAYFAPEYEARAAPEPPYTAAVRPKPDDLVLVDGRELDPPVAGRVAARREGDRFVPYPDRSAIEAVEEPFPLAFMRPEDLFFLQIQGSGVLALPDGRRLRASVAATNDRTYFGIATAMRDRGLLADNNTSGDAIRAWLADNRGRAADEVMRLNPRYVFFRLSPDDGAEPSGAAGVPLPAGRGVAVDTAFHAMGDLFWIDATAPALAGAFPIYRRLVTALDVGGAIKGQVRADLYIGRGPVAGAEAGRVRHNLRLFRLVPAAP
jgi:membrane-bound lytic murein transglycosylase A